jgi:hypothetical protein
MQGWYSASESNTNIFMACAKRKKENLAKRLILAKKSLWSSSSLEPFFFQNRHLKVLGNSKKNT